MQLRLRFFVNQSLVPSEGELVARLQSLGDERQGVVDEAERQRAEAERQRGLALTDEQAARAATETDVDRLTAWSERLSSAASADELLA